MSNDRKNKFVSIGYGNVVNSDRVLAVLSVSGHAAQRRLKIAEEQGKLIDGTCEKNQSDHSLGPGRLRSYHRPQRPNLNGQVKRRKHRR